MVWASIAWAIVKIVISVVISYALQPAPDAPADKKAAGLDQFDVPTAKAGRAIPVLFGEKELKSANVVWYGDLKVVALTETVDGGWFHSDDEYITGYKYSLGMHMVLAHEIDEIKEIHADGKTIWSGSSTGGAISINKPNLFGGEASSGGIVGTVDFERGLATQGQNDYLQSQLGTDIPAFRGVACVVLRQVYLGMSTYLQPWSFWCSRIPDSWYPAKSAIGRGANPAHIIVETLTNGLWGMSYNLADIDTTAFEAAADTLYDENLGLSMIWDYSSKIEDFLQNVLKHIDGVLYIDRYTGRFVLKLIRNDYVIDTLPVFDEDNIIKIDKFRRRTDADLVNTITVQFWDWNKGEDSSYTVSDTAAVATMGGTVSKDISYPGFSDIDQAIYAASRDLRAMSTPIVDATIYTNLEGSSLNVGDAFLLSWDRYGVTEAVMRVIAVEFGDIEKSGIRIQCVEDVYGIVDAIYTAPPASYWQDPISEPVPCPDHVMMEIPFYTIVRETNVTDALNLPDGAGFAAIAGTRPSSDAFYAQSWFEKYVYTDSGFEYIYEKYDDVNFIPRAVLQFDIGITDTTLSVLWASGFDEVNNGTWAKIGSEIIRIDMASTSQLTVGRGCLDTVPTSHATDTDILCIQNKQALYNTEKSSGDTVKGKLLPITAKGTLDISSAPEQSVTLDSRMVRPYPPANFKVNTQADPTELIGDLTLSWNHRDRTQQTGTNIVDTEDSSIGPETGTTYSYEVRKVSDDTLLTSGSGISVTSATIPAADIGFDGDVYVLCWSVRDGYSSWQHQQRQFTYTATEIRSTESGEKRLTEIDEYRTIEG